MTKRFCIYEARNAMSDGCDYEHDMDIATGTESNKDYDCVDDGDMNNNLIDNGLIFVNTVLRGFMVQHIRFSTEDR